MLGAFAIAAPNSGGSRVAGSAKARARRASLLGNDDFKRLMEMTSVSDIAVYLGKSAYASTLKGFALEEMHRSELEFLLEVSILEESVDFRHYTGMNDKKLLDIWLEYFDIMLFREHFRLKQETEEWDHHLSLDRMLDMASDFRLTLIDKDKLLSADSLKDVVMAVKNDQLRVALFDAVRGGENPAITQSAELQKADFDTGMILHRYYFNNLYTAVAGLGGIEGRLLRMLIGTRVDLMNIYWIYRARRFFDMSPEEALSLIIKARYRADFKLLRKIAFAPLNAMSSVLSGTPYSRVFEVEYTNTAQREVEIERNIYRFIFAAAERVFLSGSIGFQNIAAYLTLKELEIRDLIIITEAVRYGYDKSRTVLLLVRPLGKVN